MRLAPLLLLVPLVGACASNKVGVDLDPSYDFSGKRTFAWKEGVSTDNELMHKRIVDQVEAELASRGLQRTDANPDLWVIYDVGSRQEIRSTDSGVSVGMTQYTSWGAVGFSQGPSQRVYEVTIGELVLGVLDGPTESMVWRANAERTVGNDPQKTAATVHEVIEKAFSEFPIEPVSK